MIPNPAAALAAISCLAFLLLVPGELLAAPRRPVRPRGGPGGRGRGGSGTGDGGPAGLPAAQPWALAGDGEVLDLLRRLAENPPPSLGVTPKARALIWDSLRSVARAVAGPDDPRVWAAATRAALALAGDRDSTAAAAALATGALEGLERLATAGGRDVTAGTAGKECHAGEAAAGGPSGASGTAAGPADAAARALLRETRFARKVMAALRARLERAALPVPPPAYSLEQATSPGPDVPPDPLPGELRRDLAAAELAAGPRSREALAARSRLGEALAGEAAIAGLPGPAGGDGNPLAREARGLLRSASEGLDALLGRSHPDSLDARERLARFLAGGSGPGLPPVPFRDELPPREELREALAIYLETAAVRAASAARAAGARVWPGTSGDGDGASGDGAPPVAPSAGTRELLASHGGEAAFGAAAGAAGCALALGELSMTESFGPLFWMSRLEDVPNPWAGFGPMEAYHGLWKAAESRLGPLSPAALGLASAVAEARLADLARMAGMARGKKDRGLLAKQADPLGNLVDETHDRLRKALGTRSPETLRAAALLARHLVRIGFTLPGAIAFAGILDSLEGCAPGSAPFRGDSQSAPRISPDRLGRDRLSARASMAGCLLMKGNPATVAALLAPLADALPELAPGGGGWPWPSELAGQALVMAGEAAFRLGDSAGAGEFLRVSLRAMDPALVQPAFVGTALELAAGIFAGRGDPDSLRKAEGLRAAVSRLEESLAGQDCLLSLGTLANAMGILERAGGAGVPEGAGGAGIPEGAGGADIPEGAGGADIPEGADGAGVPEGAGFPEGAGGAGVPEGAGGAGVPEGADGAGVPEGAGFPEGADGAGVPEGAGAAGVPEGAGGTE